MTNILVVAETRDATLRPVTHELLAAGLSLAQARGGQLEAALLGSGVAALAPDLGAHAAKRVHVADSDALAQYSPDGYAGLLAAIVRQHDHGIILGSATARGRDLLPRLAAAIRAPTLSDCTAVEWQDGAILVERPMYAGKAIARLRVEDEPAVITVRPNSYKPMSPSSDRAEVVQASVADYAPRTRVVAMEATEGGKLDVSEADIIISGGRGLGGPENYAVLEELAKVLPRASVGASRAAVDAGWRPHSDQVGQTGKTVSPNLYIAVGISGAVQHLAGMKTSRFIVAINKDPDAPIFKLADYGIVGDVFEIVPAITAEAKRILRT
jgi:electron transfer flavoprotein alpha subunit